MLSDQHSNDRRREFMDGEYVDLSESGDASVTFDEVLEKFFNLSPDKPVVVGKFETCGWTQQGGQSTVFKAFDPDLQRFVAIKLYHAALNDRQKQRVLDEGRALASTDSPYVARCHSVDTIANAPFLVLEWVEGQTLGNYLRDQQLDPNEQRDLLGKIARGVDALHQQHLIHRDLKPSNILVNESGEPKIVDLGLVRHLEQGSSDAAGTFSFMAPEVAREQHDRIGVPTDIFGLGAVLYFMLTGQALYESESRSGTRARATNHDIIDPRDLEPSIPADLHQLCLTCLSEEPESRFANVSQLIEAIQFERRDWPIEIAGMAALAFAVVCSGMLWLANTQPHATPEIASRAAAESNSTVTVSPPVNDSNRGAYVASPAGDAATNGEDSMLTPWQESVSLSSDGKVRQAVEVAMTALEQKMRDQIVDSETRQLAELSVLLALQLRDVDAAAGFQQELATLERTRANEHGFAGRALEAETRLEQIEQLRGLDESRMEQIGTGAASLVRSWYLYAIDMDPKTADIAATAALDRFQKALGNHHALSVEAMEQLALLVFASEDSEQLASRMDLLDEAVLAVYGEQSAKYCSVLDRQIMVQRYRNNPVAAMATAQRAMGIAREVLEPDDETLLLLQLMPGQIVAQFGQYPMAYGSLSKALDRLPADFAHEQAAIALITHSEVCLKLEKFDEFPTRLDRARQMIAALKTQRPSVQLTLARAMTMESQFELAVGNFEKSDELFARAMDMIPGMTRGTPSHAEFYRVYCTALVDHAKQVETPPEKSKWLFRRAESRLGEAMGILNVSSIDRDSPMYLTRMAQLQRVVGDCKFFPGDYEQALAEYRQGIIYWSSLDPPHLYWMAELHFRCAWCYEMMKQFVTARSELVKAIALVDRALEDDNTPRGEKPFSTVRTFLVGQRQLMEWLIARPALNLAWP